MRGVHWAAEEIPIVLQAITEPSIVFDGGGDSGRARMAGSHAGATNPMHGRQIPMIRRTLLSVGLAAALCLSASAALIGCNGTDTRESIDDTVETMSGKDQVDQMQKLKKEIEEAGKMSDRRLESSLQEGADPDR